MSEGPVIFLGWGWVLKAKGERGLLRGRGGRRHSMSKDERSKKFLQAQGELYIEDTGEVHMMEEGAGPGWQGQELCVPFIKVKSRQGGKDAYRRSYRLLTQCGPWWAAWERFCMCGLGCQGNP